MNNEEIITAFMRWLMSRPTRSGPFGANWGTGEGEALVKEYLATLATEAAPVDTTKE